MASVFRQQYSMRDKNGRIVRKRSQFWYIDYKDGDGVRRRVRGFKDKAATAQLAAQLEREAEQVQVGIVDRYKEHRKKPLLVHLDEYRANLRNKGTTEKHACLVYSRVKAVIDGCGFVLMMDVSASKVLGYLAERRRAGLSIRSSNFYLQAIKQFCRWLVADGRVGDNPLAYLQGQNPKTDVRHARRALSSDELNRLIQATLRGVEHNGMKPKERAMLYSLAVSTGLRASELASLTWASFDLVGPEPSVKVLAAYSKHRRDDVLPLRADIVEQLQAWRDETLLDERTRVFASFNANKGAKMLRVDLNAAGIPYADAAGRLADFHSLRHSFISSLTTNGVAPKVAQSLARHGSIGLTMDVYSHVVLHDERAALNSLPVLPSLGGSAPEETRAVARRTGTDDLPVTGVENAYKPAYKKLTETAYPDSIQPSLLGTQIGERIAQAQSLVDSSNSLLHAGLDADRDRLASSVIERSRRDSNPRCLSTQRFSRPSP